MLEGFSEAVIGFCSTWHGDILVDRVVYDGEELVDILLSMRKDIPEEEAFEFIENNLINNYLGIGAPIIMWRASLHEIERYTEDEN
jgi:hypothetical protein